MKLRSNYLSIDLESWASPNLPEFIRMNDDKKKALDNGHIKASAIETLKILKKHNTKVTFFIVGQLYDWYPDVVEKIAAHGHEIGYHTHSHDAVIDKNSLTKSIQKSKKFFQRFKPIGFRAPRVSLNPECLKVLKKYGMKYDSSSYGAFSEMRKISDIFEIPVTSYLGIPIGSGYFIGLFGNKILKIYKKLSDNQSCVISFIHNWQILKPINPTFPTKKYLLTHPHYLPYMVDCNSSFEYLIKNLKMYPMKNLLQ